MPHGFERDLRDEIQFHIEMRQRLVDVMAAVQDQLGLKLEPTRAPVEVLVIDDAKRPLPD